MILQLLKEFKMYNFPKFRDWLLEASASNKCIESVVNYSYIVEDDILGINDEFDQHKYNTDPNKHQIKAH